MLKIVNNHEKLAVIRRLEGFIKNFKKENKNEMVWHSLRMNNSLKNELVPQTVFVDKYPNYNFIISTYKNKDSGRNIEIYTTNFENDNIIDEACHRAIEMVANTSMSYGQIQSSPYFLYSKLWDYVKKYKINVFEDVGANCMSFTFENINQLIQNTKPIDGFTCSPLKESDAELVNSRFKYGNHPDSLEWIKKSIETQPSMGCRNYKNELVGQFIVMESGNIGGLYVIDDCKGLKLGKWIVQETVKLFHKIDRPMILETEFSNKISYNLFNRLGFQTNASTYYMLMSKNPEITDAI